MIEHIISALGTVAAALTTLSYLPQLKKARPPGATNDLSLKMLIALTLGLCLWAIYGVLRGDWVVAGSNVLGASLVGTVLAFKIRDLRGEGS